MKYQGQYSLNENLVKGRGLGLLKEAAEEEVEAETGVEIEDDGQVVTVVDPETGESISATMDGEIVEGNVRRRRRKMVEGLRGVGTHTYGPFTFRVSANGTTEIELTSNPGVVLMTKDNEGSASGYMQQASGTVYEKAVVKSIPGAKRVAGAGNPDVSSIAMTGGKSVNAECGGKTKVSQMGGINPATGKTVKTSDARHIARRTALGHANPSAGGDDASAGTAFSSAECFAYWSACANLTGKHQEELLIASDGKHFYVFALTAGLGNLASHPNIDIPVLTAADCSAGKLMPAGRTKPANRTAPNYSTVNWNNAATIPH